MKDEFSDSSLVERLLSESARKTGEMALLRMDATAVVDMADMTSETILPESFSSHLVSDTVVNENTQSQLIKARAAANNEILLNERYEKVSRLGKGGMGLVLRVRDRLLNRTVAMKIMHTNNLGDESAVRRFVQEAQVCAQLQHPNILAIHELGVLDGGEIFITMTEIKGQSFDRHIRMVHAGDQDIGSGNDTDGWNLHRLVSVFHDVCKAVAYAHEHGVVHRDLKPQNIMVGQFGEVLLVDWGLAKVIGASEVGESVTTTRSEMPGQATVAGSIFGTPAYLAPELAVTETASANEKSDIYALGAILYELLRGRPAFDGTNMYDILVKVAVSPPPNFYRKEENAAQVIATLLDDIEPIDTPISAHGIPIPKALVDICLKAMEKDPVDRYASARDMVELVGQWLDGSRRRADALALVKQAEGIEIRIQSAEEAAELLMSQLQTLSEGVEPWHSEERKTKVWAVEDKARTIRAQVAVDSTERVQLLRSALAHKEDLEEAHLALAEHYSGVHRTAEAAGDQLRTLQAEVVLREHAEALPVTHPMRQDYLDYLNGIGTLSMSTDPAGAVLSIRKFKKDVRRWQLGEVRSLGVSPLDAHTLEMGSYIVEARMDGYHPFAYPVYNQRLSRMDGLHPNGDAIAIPLLPLGTLDDDDCYVPAGWCWLGGDVRTPNSLPRQRVWVDGFVIKAFPVTHLEYMDFLNDLVSDGRSEEAALHAPREQSSSEEELGAMVYRKNGQGQFSFPTDPDREICWPSQPVTMIQWRSARAYADWKAEKTGIPWRLPMEFEWEKSARGVDGRFYPWGDEFDPSWACMKDSHQGSIRIQSVNSFPHDISVYGVRGTAGNTRDWCLDRFREEGPPLENGALCMATDDDLADGGFKSTRGGSYGNSASRSRSADRDWWFPERSYIGRGFRIAWSVPCPQGVKEKSNH